MLFRSFAREGYMIADRERETVTLRLLDGTIYTSDPSSRASYETSFRSYDVNLDLRPALADARQRRDDPKELTLDQLFTAIAAKRAAGKPVTSELVEYHRKFSIPFACIVFALVAVPLGIQPARAVRSRGFAVSLGVIFVYYMLLSVGQGLAEHGRLSPFAGLWLPNVILGALGAWLFRRAARERPLLRAAWMDALAVRARATFPRLLGAHS